MDSNGGNVRRLTNRPGTDNFYPAVSPDGKKIVFSSQVSSVKEGQIYVMNIDGSDLQRLTSSAALNNIPSWCPDGKRVVFASDRAGNEDVFIMAADGTDLKQLTTDSGEDTTPTCTYIRKSTP
jgi:TolB protein